MKHGRDLARGLRASLLQGCVWPTRRDGRLGVSEGSYGLHYTVWTAKGDVRSPTGCGLGGGADGHHMAPRPSAEQVRRDLLVGSEMTEAFFAVRSGRGGPQ